MAITHRCHTCCTEYNCISKWCPGCGKRLGHSDPRNHGYATCQTEYDYGGTPWLRCSSCGHVSYVATRNKYCGECGAKWSNR